MRKREVIRYAILSTLVVLFAVSCKYDDVLPPPPPENVSFSEDIIPIFNSSCNLAGCHNAAGHVPDLSPASAYDNLWNGMYIDTMVPEDSELYMWMAGLRGLPMPVEGVNNGYTSTVLEWIRSGAPDN